MAFVIANLSGLRMGAPSLDGCYLLCHAHTSAAHREEVSLQGTWLIEGTGHTQLCAGRQPPVNAKDGSQETLLSASAHL